jgi:hypothetical protein
MEFTCKVCGTTHDLPITEAQMLRWKSGSLAHRVFHFLDKDQRELIISGTCGPCFDNLFMDEIKTTAQCLQTQQSPQ